MDQFGIGIARSVAGRIVANCPKLSESSFVDSAINEGSGGWVSRITTALRIHLPNDFPNAVDVMLRSLGPELPPEQSMPEAHALTPFVNFVADYGTNHFDLSMSAFHALAKRTYTAQAGVRRFIMEHPESTMRVLREWVHDPCPHVRRSAVNATRPRLRYAVMPGLSDLHFLRDDPEPVLQLLENVRCDPSKTVRRAVAGSLSDIAKDKPDMVYGRIEVWLRNGAKETRLIARQALRYASRKGDPRAAELLEQAKAK